MMITNLVGTAAATRLLYGIGRDGVISRRFFSAVNKRFKTPHWNIIFIMLIEIGLGSFVNPDHLAELINYGAISGFIMLNLTVIWFGWKRIRNVSNMTVRYVMKVLMNFLVFPMIGLAIMLSIFVNMKMVTIAFGTIWGLVGIFYYQTQKDKNMSESH